MQLQEASGPSSRPGKLKGSRGVQLHYQSLYLLSTEIQDTLLATGLHAFIKDTTLARLPSAAGSPFSN